MKEVQVQQHVSPAKEIEVRMSEKPQESYQILSNYSTQKEDDPLQESDQESLDPNNCSVDDLRKKLEAIRDNKNLLE